MVDASMRKDAIVMLVQPARDDAPRKARANGRAQGGK